LHTTGAKQGQVDEDVAILSVPGGDPVIFHCPLCLYCTSIGLDLFLIGPCDVMMSARHQHRLPQGQPAVQRQALLLLLRGRMVP
jgi:hypothetical protein